MTALGRHSLETPDSCVGVDDFSHGRVLLVSNGFQPNYEAGFANALARNGVRVTLVASDETLRDQLERAIEVVNLRGSQDPRRSAWRKASNLLRYLWALWWLAWRHRGVVHLTGLSAFANFGGAWPIRLWAWECWSLRLVSQRLVLTVHNVLPHDGDTPAVRRGLAAVYAVPQLLVVHTPAAWLRLADEFGIPPARVVVMEHGLDDIVVRSQDDINATRAGLGYGPGEKVVLFLGWVRRYKGVDLLLDACKHLEPNIRVLIAGNCIDTDYRHELERAIVQNKLQATVQWEFGYLAEDRVSALLAAADVLVMPYRHIDQSGVLFAALRHGVPVVAFDVGSLRDYLPEGTGRIVPPGDVVGLARALDDVPPAHLSRPTILAAASRYQWSSTVRPVLPVYRFSAAGGKGDAVPPGATEVRR